MRSKSSAGAPHTEEREDKFGTFVYSVFVAVVLAAGGVVWSLIKDNASLDKRLTVLEHSCLPPVSGGAR